MTYYGGHGGCLPNEEHTYMVGVDEVGVSTEFLTDDEFNNVPKLFLMGNR